MFCSCCCCSVYTVSVTKKERCTCDGCLYVVLHAKPIVFLTIKLTQSVYSLFFFSVQHCVNIPSPRTASYHMALYIVHEMRTFPGVTIMIYLHQTKTINITVTCIRLASVNFNSVLSIMIPPVLQV